MEQNLGQIGRPVGPHEMNQNGVIQPLLTDLYQITMAYAYWKSNKCSDHAVFDLFFRKNPFGGEFTVFAGLDECLKFLQNFHYSPSDITYLKRTLSQSVDEQFFEFLGNLTAKEVILYAVPEGTVVFPRVPLIRVEGPLPVVQLLETTLLTLVNYASLVATNAARYRMAAGKEIQLLEFGLRRAQGPDGGLSASKYAYIGGFDGTSNVLAGKLYGIPVKGTHAHAFIMSYSNFDISTTMMLDDRVTGEQVDFVKVCLKWQKELSQFLHIINDEASSGELAAFIAYAVAFPDSFLALIDTYDVLRSGLLNFCAVALALNDLGYKAIGVRIDSGDLAYLSIVSRDTFEKVAEKYNVPWFSRMTIIASNDINEDTIISLNEQLVEVKKTSCIKLSLDVEKVTIPSKKTVYRLYGQDGYALVDLMQREPEEAPVEGQRVLCRHPFQESKRAYVIPSKVESLQKLCWQDGKICIELPTLLEVRQYVKNSLKTIRPDIRRNLNPTPYKVSVSDELYQFMHDLWLQHAPIGELS